MQVMVDGRTVYVRLLSEVSWDTLIALSAPAMAGDHVLIAKIDALLEQQLANQS